MSSQDCDYLPDTLHLFLIIIYSVGILGNLTIKLVLLWKGDKSVVNKLLIMLAVWDNLFLVCRLGEVVSLGGWKGTVIKDPGYLWTSIGCFVDNYFYRPEVYCKMLNVWWKSDPHGTTYHSPTSYIFYTLSAIFQLASVYHTVIIAVFRFIAIISPFKASTLCTGHRAIFSCVVSFIICICVHLPGIIFIPVFQTYMLCFRTSYMSSFKLYRCMGPVYSSIFYQYLHPHWSSFFPGYHIIFYNVLIFFALPFTVLLILNIIMLRELWRSSSAQTNDAAEEENKAVTKVVVVVVTMFLVTYIVKPLYIIDMFYFKGHIINSFTNISCTAYYIVHVLAYIVPIFNSVVNIFIYLLLRKSFRSQFFSVFQKCRNQQNSQPIELNRL